MSKHRVDITVSGHEADIVDEVLLRLALEDDLEIYERSGRLVHIRQGEEGPKIESVESARMRDIVSRHCVFFRAKETKKGYHEVSAMTPSWVGDMIIARPEWPGFERLIDVTSSPFMRADGSICSVPGYDRISRRYVSPECVRLEIDENEQISQADVAEAAAGALEPFSEFPFAEEVHRGVLLAFMLSAICRPMIDGPVPLFLADAPVPAAGKGRLIDAASIIVTGRKASASPWASTEEERRKVVTSRLAEGGSIILFDNVTSTLGGASIDAVLTSTLWTDRMLGKSESLTLPNRAVWCATANNCNVGGDTARRTLLMRLQPKTARPEERRFKREDLLDHVHRNRPELLRQLFRVARGYMQGPGAELANGRSAVLRAQREMGLEAYGSFEAWSATVRGMVVYAGFPDPVSTKERLKQHGSTELDELRRLVTLLKEYQDETRSESWTTGDLRKALANDLERSKNGHERKYEDLVDVLAGMSRTKNGAIPSSKSLGWTMRRNADRIVELDDGQSLSIASHGNYKNTTLWTVSGGLLGFLGSTSYPAGKKKEKEMSGGLGGDETLETRNPPEDDEVAF